jgi:hypothetical protein
MYLSSIQNGIQPLHVVTEIFVKYLDDKESKFQLFFLQEWARKHNTVIVLNAGYSSEIQDLVDFFYSEDNPYPWECFHEADDALNGALTSVGIIVPEKIYSLSKELRERKESHEVFSNARFIDDDILGFVTYNGNDYSNWELELARKLNDYSLAS